MKGMRIAGAQRIMMFAASHKTPPNTAGKEKSWRIARQLIA